MDLIQSTQTEPVVQPVVPSYLPVADPDSSEVRVVLRALWLKDPATYEHCLRVSEYVGAVAARFEMPAFVRTRMRGAAFLHDIGKLCVSQPVLDADRALNSQERTKVRSHAVLGYELLWVVPGLEGYAHAVRSHHERWDGAGYPDHLSGIEIPMTARLITVADSFDVMTIGRNYAPSKTNLEIVKDLVRGAWRQFDPGAVRAFLQTWIDGRLPGVQSLDGEALALAQYALV